MLPHHASPIVFSFWCNTNNRYHVTCPHLHVLDYLTLTLRCCRMKRSAWWTQRSLSRADLDRATDGPTTAGAGGVGAADLGAASGKRRVDNQPLAKGGKRERTEPVADLSACRRTSGSAKGLHGVARLGAIVSAPTARRRCKLCQDGRYQHIRGAIVAKSLYNFGS